MQVPLYFKICTKALKSFCSGCTWCMFILGSPRSKIRWWNAVSDARTQMWTIQIAYYKFSHHLYTFTSFLFLAFPSALTTFPSTFTCQQSIPQTLLNRTCRHLSNQIHESLLAMLSFSSHGHHDAAYLTLFFSSSGDVLGSHAVYLASQLLLWIVFLAFPQLLNGFSIWLFTPP